MTGTVVKLSDHQQPDGHTATDSLPFVREGLNGKRNYWSVPSTGDIHHDYELGHHYGERAVAALFHDGGSGSFGFIVVDMIRAYGGKRVPEGLIVGFMSALVNHLQPQPRVRLPTAIEG